MQLGIDANTKLAGGFRVGYAIPHSDMTAGDEERAIFLVNFMAKNGLASQYIWNAAAPPQEEMHTKKEWDKREIMGNLTVVTQVDYVLTLPPYSQEMQSLLLHASLSASS